MPYILGANIATFIDTLIAAATMEHSGALVVVTVELVSVAGISILVLLLVYKRYEAAMLAAAELVTAASRHVVLLAALVALPPALLLAFVILGGK